MRTSAVTWKVLKKNKMMINTKVKTLTIKTAMPRKKPSSLDAPALTVDVDKLSKAEAIGFCNVLEIGYQKPS